MTNDVKLQEEYFELKQLVGQTFDEAFKVMPVTDETQCGFDYFKGQFLQK